MRPWSSRAVNRASSEKFDALSSQQLLSTELERIEAANGKSINRELLPAFLKDRSKAENHRS